MVIVSNRRYRIVITNIAREDAFYVEDEPMGTKWSLPTRMTPLRDAVSGAWAQLVGTEYTYCDLIYTPLSADFQEGMPLEDRWWGGRVGPYYFAKVKVKLVPLEKKYYERYSDLLGSKEASVQDFSRVERAGSHLGSLSFMSG